MKKKSNFDFFITTDLHLGMSQLITSADRLELTVLNNIKKEIVKQQPKHVLILGDIFHSKDKVSATLLEIFKDFLKEITELTHVIILVGNHDFSVVHNQHTYHSLNFFKMKNLTVVRDIYKFNDKIGFMNYSRTKELFESRLQELGNIEVLFGHLDINGFALGDDYVEKHSYLSPDDLVNFKAVISGHYHEPQELIKANHSIIYVGSPYTTAFGESDQEKRYLLFNSETYETKSIKSNMTWHKTLRISALDSFPEIPEEDLKKNIRYRVVVKGTKEQIDVMDKPKKYPALISFNLEQSDEKRIELNSKDGTDDIVKKYTDAEINKNYDEETFDLDRLKKAGLNLITRARNK